MATEDLKQALLQLHKALASGEPIDPELPPLLRMLDIDIQTALARRPGPGQPLAALVQPEPDLAANPVHTSGQPVMPDAAPGLTTRAQEISAKFAVRHPHLEPVLRELTETLQRIGI